MDNMKDPKNIKRLNLLATYYVTLHGIQGKALNPENPFSEYYANLMMKGNFLQLLLPNLANENIIVSTSFFHDLIKEAFNFYTEVDEVESLVHPMMKEQISHQLGDIKFDEFIESSVNIYKNSFFELLNNYNSYKEDYVEIKLNVLEEYMNDFAVSEYYEKAAEMRDKILEIKEHIDKIKNQF